MAKITPPKRKGPGRPKGSKNKPTKVYASTKVAAKKVAPKAAPVKKAKKTSSSDVEFVKNLIVDENINKKVGEFHDKQTQRINHNIDVFVASKLLDEKISENIRSRVCSTVKEFAAEIINHSKWAHAATKVHLDLVESMTGEVTVTDMLYCSELHHRAILALCSDIEIGIDVSKESNGDNTAPTEE